MADKDLKYRLTLQDLFSKKMQGAVDSTKRMDGAMSGLGGKIAGLAAGLGVAMLGKNIIETTAKFQSLENAIKATGGANASKNLEFLNGQIDKLGMNVNAAYSGYKTFSGALMGTNLAGEKGNQIFRQVSEAATVMGLSGEQSEGAFLALGQMMSKGTVSAEELRGQLGERIPGAFQIAARAMGVTTQALGDMMKKGELAAEDFLPKFGAELEKSFGKQAGVASQSLQSNLNRLDTSMERLKVTAGEALLPAILSLTKALTGFFVWVKSNINTIVFLGKALMVVVGAMVAFQVITKAIALVQGVQLIFTVVKLTAALEGTTLAQAGLNTIMSANPIGVMIAAVTALVTVIYGAISAYNEFQDVLSGKGRLDTQTGLKEEMNSVTALADRYVALGKTKEQAMQLAIGQERGALESKISGLKSRIASGEGDTAAYQRQLTHAQGALGALSDEKGLISGYGANGASSLASGGKGGSAGASSAKSSSLGSSTEVSSARPQSLVINIDSLVKDMKIVSDGTIDNVNNWANKVRSVVSQVLLETANDANLAAR